MPPNTVYVGRPTRWGNPFIYVDGLGLHERLHLYRRWLAGLYPPASDKMFQYLRDRGQKARDSLAELRGKNLACWCPLDQPCHADVLLELANGR
jgi:hypothetical protein